MGDMGNSKYLACFLWLTKSAGNSATLQTGPEDTWYTCASKAKAKATEKSLNTTSEAKYVLYVG